MSENRIPSSAPDLIHLGTNLLAGLNSLGETLGITQVPPATFEFALQDFVACENSFNALRSAKTAASTAWVQGQQALRAWLEVTRSVLAGRFGPRWSGLWVQAGFNDHSTAVPRTAADQLALAQTLALFFTAHPTYEVAGMLVTAARATTLRNTALAAEQALAAAEVNASTQWDTRTTSREALVGLVRTVIAVLKRTLEPLDPRWTTFGLNKPGADTTPGQPADLVVTVDAATGNILAQCAPEPLAHRYRWRMRVVGAESVYRLVARSVPPLALIAPVSAGTQVEILVEAVNAGAQSVASVPVLFTMPGSTTAKAMPVPSAVRRESGNGNGSGHAEGNGNGKGLHLRTT